MINLDHIAACPGYEPGPEPVTHDIRPRGHTNFSHSGSEPAPATLTGQAELDVPLADVVTALLDVQANHGREPLPGRDLIDFALQHGLYGDPDNMIVQDR